MMVVKIGGGEQINTKGILQDIAALDESVIIVHGANALRDELAEKLGSPRKNITSLKGVHSVFSDAAAIDIMMMSYSGLRNKRIVEQAHQLGVNAIGLTGLDGKLIQGKRNPGIRVQENGKKKILRDFSGKPISVNTTLILLLLENGYTPVITVPIIDQYNIAINTQNDLIIAAIAAALKADTIVDLFAEKGFMEDRDNPASLVPYISKAELPALIQKTTGGMQRKIDGVNRALENGVKRIIFGDGRVESPLQKALAGAGTIIE